MKAIVKTLLLVVTGALLSACDNGSTTYSLLEDGSSFRQNSGTQDAKIDVLWVIDNSGSMATSQQNLADNFPSFIDNFTDKGLDFQMAVTTTEAFLALSAWTSYYNLSPRPHYYEGLAQEEIARFRDGRGANHSGFFVLTPATPNINTAFVTNALQGITGKGDERSLQSMRAALDSPLNPGFVRAGGYLAVVLVTDEDDFSHDGTAQYERYDRPLHTIDSYVQYLDGLTASSGAARKYSVNTISVNNQDCLDSIFNGAQKIGLRVGQLAEATGGIKGNLCGDFAQELDLISEAIVQLAVQFSLGNKKPIESTIRVSVNGVQIPKSSTNPLGDGGWSYNSAANSIMFHGSNYIPPQGASINVAFDPEELTF